MPRIVLMGEPGSGKTTLAKKIARHLSAVLVEAATSVVYPIAAMPARLPQEHALLKKLSALPIKKSLSVSRELAMETFSRIARTYSPDFIARALHARHASKTAHVPVVFSGLRGVENAAYCRLHNDFLVYLDADPASLVKRLIKDRGYDKQQALQELQQEQELYHTRKIKELAHLVVETSKHDVSETVQTIVRAFQREYQMCKRCVNTARNPAMRFDRDGYCQICSAYMKHFDKKHLANELHFLKSFKGAGKGGYDVMVGVSGGKDSTATLATIKKMGFRPLAFTFDLGYLPETTIPRAKKTAQKLGIDYVSIDIRSYIRKNDLASYKKIAALYEEPFSLATKKKFSVAYAEGRKHYSVKCTHAPVFVRTCQLCRRMVIRAYYGEARKRHIPALVLGINEWTNLSAAQRGGVFRVSGMRTLRPKASQSPVHIFHLPFLLQRSSSETKKMLKKLGWQAPKGEDFIESNSNSCLLARSTERMAKRLLGFHPDSTRLAREVTVGFITKRQAMQALGKIHPYRYTPRHILERAGILRKSNRTEEER